MLYIACSWAKSPVSSPAAKLVWYLMVFAPKGVFEYQGYIVYAQWLLKPLWDEKCNSLAACFDSLSL